MSIQWNFIRGKTDVGGLFKFTLIIWELLHSRSVDDGLLLVHLHFKAVHISHTSAILFHIN